MAGRAKYTAADLLVKAEGLLEQMQHDVAVRFLEKAREQEPDNIAVLDTLRETLLELSKPQGAYEIRASRYLFVAR